MTGLVEITEYQMAQSKYTARKWFLFIMEVHSAVLASLHTSTSMQYYETNGTSTAQQDEKPNWQEETNWLITNAK